VTGYIFPVLDRWPNFRDLLLQDHDEAFSSLRKAEGIGRPLGTADFVKPSPHYPLGKPTRRGLSASFRLINTMYSRKDRGVQTPDKGDRTEGSPGALAEPYGTRNPNAPLNQRGGKLLKRK
jgi:hypothetical protein